MIEFFFDCSSPRTWLAFRNLQPMARELGVEVRWRPVLVGGIFNAVNPSVYEFRERGVPAKQAYLRKDLQDWARHCGLTLHFPPAVFPVNSVKAMRGCLLLEPEGRLLPFAESVFEAYWSRQLDISRDEVLAELAAGVGVEPARFLEGIARPDIKAALKANTDEVIARGGFGSPTIFVGGDDMYFGNDRLVLVREAVLRRQAAARAAPGEGVSP
jgi:2-hydroxychromene-2-carboxylate isomerase